MTAQRKSYAEFLADKVRFDSTFGHHVDWDGEIEPGVVPDLIACLVRVLPGWRL